MLSADVFLIGSIIALIGDRLVEASDLRKTQKRARIPAYQQDEQYIKPPGFERFQHI
jgi:hypothetical protein